MTRSTSTEAAEILIAAYLQVTERTIYRLSAADDTPVFKVGGYWRFRRGELDQWIAGRTAKSGAADREGVA